MGSLDEDQAWYLEEWKVIFRELLGCSADDVMAWATGDNGPIWSSLLQTEPPAYYVAPYLLAEDFLDDHDLGDYNDAIRALTNAIEFTDIPYRYAAHRDWVGIKSRLATLLSRYVAPSLPLGGD